MKNEMKRTAISIVILGEQAVGKTMICSRFLGLEFRNEHLTTVGIEKMSKTIKIDTGEEIMGYSRSRAVQINLFKKCQIFPSGCSRFRFNI